MVTADTGFSITGSGLKPGTKVEASATFTPTEGSGQERGFSAQHVKDDGTVKFTEQLSNLTGGRPGSIRAWIREKGSAQFADPIVIDGEAQEVTVSVP